MGDDYIAAPNAVTERVHDLDEVVIKRDRIMLVFGHPLSRNSVPSSLATALPSRPRPTRARHEGSVRLQRLFEWKP
jgi:hypothetical protein